MYVVFFLLAMVGELIDLQDCLSVYFSPRDDNGSAALSDHAEAMT